MFGARFAVFMRRVRVLLSSFSATRNFRSFRHSLLEQLQLTRKIGNEKLVVSATKRAPMQE
jgi:hypothetical protein